MKKVLILIIAAAMVLSLCACGGGGSAADDPYAGEYTAFAIETEGFVMDIEEFGMESGMTLEAGGKGYMTIDDEGGKITDWSVDGDKISVTSGGETLEGTIKDGIIKLDLGVGYFYYAAEGTDTSSVDTQSTDDLVDALLSEDSEDVSEDASEEASDDSAAAAAPAAGVDDFDPNIVSDDSHFVMELAGVTLVYTLDGNNVIGLYGFMDLGSESMAKSSADTYPVDDTITAVEAHGSYIVIVYADTYYDGQTLTALETAFGDKKIK